MIAPTPSPVAPGAAADFGTMKIDQGAKLGMMIENHFGVDRPAQPVLIGERLGSAEGWASVEDAAAAVRELQGANPGAHRGSAVALIRDEGRFFAHFLRSEHGQDVRPWHIPVRFEPTDERWVTTVMGPFADSGAWPS